LKRKYDQLGKIQLSYCNHFLGTDVGVASRNRQLRSDFNLQISVPVVSYFLELLKENKEESKILSYSDIFSQNQPTQVVLNHFKNHFGFEFESLQWLV
jgi:hypothetical protein